MKLLIIRHGDPDYSIDSLTEKGWKEASFLAERLAKAEISKFYVSPLGRAKDTASCTLKKLNRTATELEWLREFNASIKRPDANGDRTIAWDWLPQDWTCDERYYQYDQWYKTPIMEDSNIKSEYDMVVHQLDQLIATHGYTRQGHLYHADKSNQDTIALFCHFGVECVLLSHLLSISPMTLWHGACAAPTSVTTLVTEERREGIASFRMSSFGDTSHLYANDETPAFAARFCECYNITEQRHD